MTTPEQAEPLPCGWCDSLDRQDRQDRLYDYVIDYLAGCDDRPALLKTPDRDKAIKAWNTRHRDGK